MINFIIFMDFIYCVFVYCSYKSAFIWEILLIKFNFNFRLNKSLFMEQKELSYSYYLLVVYYARDGIVRRACPEQTRQRSGELVHPLN